MSLRNRMSETAFAILLGLQSIALGSGGLPQAETPSPPGDPFALRGAESGESGFVSVAPASLPPGIRVVGILTPRQGGPVGVLDIPGAQSLHFVREKDVIQFEASDGARAASRAGASGSQSIGPIYLLVVSISENQVEIAPKARPQETRIYR